MSKEVQQMFAKISSKYDLMNDVLSFGIHHIWRNFTVRKANIQLPIKILDCATGTGDLAIAFHKKIVSKAEFNGLPLNNNEIVATDFCDEMLVYAKNKIAAKEYPIKVENADVLNLQYSDYYFDIASISFGIRNVDNPSKGVSELARVVKPNGKVMILEFGQPIGWFAQPYNFYSKNIMPFFGKLIAGDQGAYTYLPETASKFPSGENFKKIMENTNSFSDIKYYPLSFGIAYLYVGIVK
jgi:demethylmenaquinone methyltransferase/2-methoxy-6-polyprenyl-1,4-benzoquinol methylase